MSDIPPTDSSAGNDVHQFECATGVEVIVHGDESRTSLAQRVIENLETIPAKAVWLLESFMRDRGAFDQQSIEVLATVTPEEGDFVLRYSFAAEREPHEYNDTYFDVFFFCHEPPQEPFWPFKFTVGFH